MSDVYYIGDVVTLATTVTNMAGALADPSTLVLTYTDQAGAAVMKTWPTPADITRDSIGAFHYDVAGLAAGHYTYTWTAAGLNAGTRTDVFDVLDPAAVPRYVSVADAKAFLRLTGTADDALLDRMVTWASARITREVGAVVLSTWTETVRADGGFILSHVPVVLLTSVTPLTAYTPAATLSNLVITNPLAGTVDAISGTNLSGYYTVVYRAGYASVPPGVDGATLELIQHWWTQSQAHRSSTFGEDNPFITDFSTLPNAVLNKLAAIPRIPGVA